MEDIENFSKHYISLDGRGCIVDGFSDAFRVPAETDICINERGGYQFRLFPDGEENPALSEENAIPLYKYVDGAVVKRTAEEIAADIASIPAKGDTPTFEDDAAAMLVDHEYRLALLEVGFF